MNKILIIGAKGQLGQSFQYWAPHFPHFKFYFKAFWTGYTATWN